MRTRSDILDQRTHLGGDGGFPRIERPGAVHDDFKEVRIVLHT
jgi:hypothetical protein